MTFELSADIRMLRLVALKLFLIACLESTITTLTHWLVGLQMLLILLSFVEAFLALLALEWQNPSSGTNRHTRRQGRWVPMPCLLLLTTFF